MKSSRRLLQFVIVSALVVLAACSRTRVAIPAPSAASSNNSYVDLKAGSTLRIVVPLLKSGEFQSQLLPENVEDKGITISLSAADLLGFTTLRYAVIGKNDEVRLRFLSAEESRDGKIVPAKGVPNLPFELPRRTEHIRLIYLVRASQANHNMVILASKRIEALNTLTKQLQEHVSVCHSDAQTFCSWVPAGVAVRTEANGSPGQTHERR